MATHTISVHGMSCGHCVSAVTAELSKVDGVTGVEVDLAAKTVNVSLADSATFDLTAITAAIDEAGFELVA